MSAFVSGLERLRLMLFGVALCAALVLAWQMVKQPLPRARVAQGLQAQTPDQSAPDALAAQIAGYPEYAPYFAALKSDFGAEYNKLSSKLALGQQTHSGPDAAISMAMLNVRETYGVLAGKADGAALDQILQAQQAILLQLDKGNAKLCVGFFFGGSTPGFTDFATLNRGLVAQLAQANLAAIRSGRLRGVAADEPTDADVQMLNDALLKKGLDEPAIALLLDAKTPDPAMSDTAMCEAGIAYLSSLLALPDAVRLRLTARSVTLAAQS